MFSFVSNQMNLRVNYAQSNKISFEGHGPRAFETFAGELIQPRQHGVWQWSGFVQTEEPDTVGQGTAAGLRPLHPAARRGWVSAAFRRQIGALVAVCQDPQQPPDIRRVLEIAKKFGLEFLPPPVAQSPTC